MDVLTHNDTGLISAQEMLVIFAVTFGPVGIPEAAANVEKSSCRSVPLYSPQEARGRVFHFISQKKRGANILRLVNLFSDEPRKA